EFIGFDGDDPFVVAQGEGGHGVGLHTGVGHAAAAVVGEHAAAFGFGQQVPLVGAHERVDGEPPGGRDVLQEGGYVPGVEFGRPVDAHGGPGGQQRLQQGRGAQLPQGALEVLGAGAVQPDHQIGVGLEAGDVVEAAGGDGTAGLDLLQGCFELCGDP